LLDFHKIQY